MTTAEVVEPPATGIPSRNLATAWPRFWARQLDATWETTLVVVALALAWPDLLSREAFVGPGGDQLVGIMVLPFALFLDALIVGIFGNSPGKALVGISVRELRGGRPSFSAIAARNGRLWFAGLGLGIGIIALITMYRSRRALDRGETLSWDNAAATRCYDDNSSVARCTAAAVALVALCALAIWAGVTAEQDSTDASAIAASINAQSPELLDEETRLEGASAGPGQLVAISYTLVNVSYDSHDLNEVGTILDMIASDSLKPGACGYDGLRPFLDAGGTVDYQYSDVGGSLIRSYQFSLSDCR